VVVLLTLAGLLLGSIPFSVVVGRLAGGGDVRRFGDGNPGAANVLRAAGWGWHAKRRSTPCQAYSAYSMVLQSFKITGQGSSCAMGQIASRSLALCRTHSWDRSKSAGTTVNEGVE